MRNMALVFGFVLLVVASERAQAQFGGYGGSGFQNGGYGGSVFEVSIGGGRSRVTFGAGSGFGYGGGPAFGGYPGGYDPRTNQWQSGWGGGYHGGGNPAPYNGYGRGYPVYGGYPIGQPVFQGGYGYGGGRCYHPHHH